MINRNNLIIHRDTVYLKYLNFSGVWRVVWNGNNDIGKNSDFINYLVANKYIYVNNGIYQMMSEYFNMDEN